MAAKVKSEAEENPAAKAPFGSDGTLVAIKLAHTVIWAFLAGSIVGLPVLAWTGQFRLVAILTAVILAECCVLALNHMRCPLTDLAMKYTDDRSPNFDIYMPAWLARHNKAVFGTLFVVNELIVLAEWGRAR
jgi:hypothetical protein